jgi:hypothetical protein
VPKTSNLVGFFGMMITVIITHKDRKF